MAPMAVVNIEALHELAALLAALLRRDGGPMLQAQRDSLLPEGALQSLHVARHITDLPVKSLVALPVRNRLYAKLRKPHVQNWSSKTLGNFGGRVARFFDARFDRRSQEA